MVNSPKKTITQTTEILGGEEVTVITETGWIGDINYRRIDYGKKYGHVYIQIRCRPPLFETDQKGES